MPLGTQALPRERWRELATALEAELTGQSALFPAEPDITALVEVLFKRKEARLSPNRRPLWSNPAPNWSRSTSAV
jgi:hypothetical protein